jgi:hypothetical protein
MTLGLVAVLIQDIRDGKPVIGHGFNSNGRYGQGALIREQLRSRVLEVYPHSLIDTRTENFDPHSIWAAMLKNKKPGGHGERSVAIGTINWPFGKANVAGKPLFQLPAERYGTGKANPKVFVHAARGLRLSRQGDRRPQGRDAGLYRPWLNPRENENRVPRLPWIWSALRRCSRYYRVDASSRSMPTDGLTRP